MNKYYVPSFEEFYVGFEYESLIDPRDPDNDNSWSKDKVRDLDSLYNYCLYNRKDPDGDYRVKYLDKTDIEELGFEESFDEPDEWFWKFKGDINIQLYFDDKIRENNQGIGISIYNSKYGTNDWDTGLVFIGYIKNKSELKVLLKQLGIC